MSKRKKRTLLIDADMTIFTAAAACTRDSSWGGKGGNVWTTSMDVGEALGIIKATVKRHLRELDGDRAILALSDHAKYWRREIYAEYKSNRKGTRKPPGWARLEALVIDSHETLAMGWLEGDDVLGILATGRGLTGTKIIVSGDKDMLTIPGQHYNPRKPEEGVITVTRKQADRFHLMQTLMGDSTDGYPGCPGVGPKSADKILPPVTEWDETVAWEAICEAYRAAWDKGKINARGDEYPADFALVQAQVARILRAGEYSKKTSEVHLWRPACMKASA